MTEWVAPVLYSYSTGYGVSTALASVIIPDSIVQAEIVKRRKIHGSYIIFNATTVTTEQTLSSDARIKTTSSTTFQQNAFLNSKQVLSQNARLKTTIEQTLLENASIKLLGQIQTILEDARLKTTITQTLSENARLKETITKTLSENSTIKAVQTQTILEDARLKQTVEQLLSENARLKDTISKTLSENARIFLTVTQTLGENASLRATGIEKLLSQNATLIGVGITQTLGQEARVKLTQSQSIAQNAQVKFNPAAGPANVFIDIDSIVAPIVDQTEFPVYITLTATNGDPIANRVVFLQKSLDKGTTWKTIRRARTSTIGIALIKHKETLSTNKFEPKVILYRGLFKGDNIILDNQSIPVQVSIQSGNLRSPTPFPLTAPNQAVTLMKGTDTYLLLPSGQWLKLPKIIADRFGKFTVEPNT